MHTYFAANEEDGLNMLCIVPFIDVWPIVNKGLKNKIHIIYELNKHHIRYCADKNVYKKTGNEILDKIIKNPKYIKNLKSKTKKYADEMIAFAKKIQKAELTSLSDKELMEVINRWEKIFLSMLKYSVGLAIMELSNDLLTEYLGKILEDKIKKSKAKKSINEYFRILTTSKYIDSVKAEYVGLLKIASLGIKHNDFDKLIKKHAAKFFWINYGYQGPILKEQHFRKRIKELIRKNPKKLLKEWKKDYKNISKGWHRAAKQLKLNSQEKRLFSAARDSIFIKLYRKDALTFTLASLEAILKQISKRTGYSLRQIRHCTPDEINLLFDKKIKKKELNDRYYYSVYYLQRSRPLVLTGGKAKKFMKKMYIKEDYSYMEELKGTSASPGKAQGRVKIINKASDMNKMKAGDVLVSISTIPEIVPAMKKAGAIITDIGGITSHAAIVSRELHKPCVIGTKYATKVLKDNKKVEVNANKGIIRLL